MSAPPYKLVYSPEIVEVLEDMRRKPGQYRAKLKKVQKTVQLLRDYGPSYPGLNAHKYESVTEVVPGRPVWEVYVENRTPGAWRLFYCHGPGVDQITLLTVGPHP